MSHVRNVSLSCFIFAIAMGCSRSDKPEPRAPQTTAPTDDVAKGTDAPRDSGALSDEQILEITHVANTGEVAQAKVAQQKATNPAVKNFAAMMVKDHGDADAKGSDIAKKNNLTPSDSATSASLKFDSERTVELLKLQSGAEFDRSYMDAQVKEHQTVLDIIDNKLIPNARTDDVKALLKEVRPKVEGHLRMAQDIEGSLGAAR